MKNISYLAVCFSLSVVAIMQAQDAPFIDIKGHTNAITSVAFSPDGEKIVTGSVDKTAKIWDTATGRNLTTLVGHTNTVTSVAFSPDGEKIVTGSVDKTAKIWDTATGRNLQKLTETTCLIPVVNSVAFSPDGKKIIAGIGSSSHNIGTTCIWDATTGKELPKLKPTSGNWRGSVDSVALSPDGKKIVTVCSPSGTVQIWDAKSGKELKKLEEKKTERVNSVAFSPDGKKIVTGTGSTGSRSLPARIWDAETGQELIALENEGADQVAFSLDGKKIVGGKWDGTVRIWDAESGKELQILGKHTDRIRSVVFSPAGKTFTTGSSDGTVRIWDWIMVQEQLAKHIAEEKRIAEERETGRMLFRAGAADLLEELHKSGYNYRGLSALVQFGNTGLQDEWEGAEKAYKRALTEIENNYRSSLTEAENNYRKADEFDKTDAQARLKTVKDTIEAAKKTVTQQNEKIMAELAQKVRRVTAEIAQKTLFYECIFTSSGVKVDGDKSSFMMVIPAGFSSPKYAKIEWLSPMSNVTGELLPLQYLSAPVVDYAFLTKDDKLRLINTMEKDRILEEVPNAVLYARYGAEKNIVLLVSGSTDSIRELVRNNDNYRVRMLFTNLKFASRQNPVMYARINRDGTPVRQPDDHIIGTPSPYPNPFVTADKETVETVTADVLKIEIIKVK